MHTGGAEIHLFDPDASQEVQHLPMWSCCHCGAGGPRNEREAAAVVGVLLRGNADWQYCPKCDAVCCATCADRCTPLEQRLDNIEAGRHEFAARPVQIIVPGF